MPGGQSLNQSVIEESWERIEKQFKLDASAAASGNAFSIDASGSRMSNLRTEQEAYYAVRTSFVPLWTVYLPDVTKVSEAIFDLEIPTPFRHEHRPSYDVFFERFGTHYVNRAWVGGKAILSFSVEKSSEMTKEDIQAGLKASLAGVGSASVDVQSQHSKEKLKRNSECTVSGKGGDELSLAALSSLDEAAYNEWLKSVKRNPQTIELEVAGIWTLLKDRERAQALWSAYKEATTFAPVTAVFAMGKEIYFLRGDRFVLYDREKNQTQKPRKLMERWPALAELVPNARFDAALRGDYIVSPEGEDLSGKLFLFRRHKYLRLDLATGMIDEGYPKLVSEGWPGVIFDRIDAAFNEGPEHIYFFSGNQYVRFSIPNHRVDEGYPQLITRRWHGVTFDRIDASLYMGNGKVLFFREDLHIRYDMTVRRADPGYPKAIVGSYVEDWKFFD
jgi:hypothetical protein